MQFSLFFELQQHPTMFRLCLPYFDSYIPYLFWF